MKICFVGKGGSGKTTISALLSRYLAFHKFPVLAIDADINQHLAITLGLDKATASTLKPLGIEMRRIKEYVKGTNPLLSDTDSIIKTTPPGNGSVFLKISEENPIYTYFSKMINGIRVLAVGAFDESDLGVKCYHSKTGSVELLLNHLIDTENEYAVVDMTAGADSFASGLFTRFDITFLVVEPTIKSTSVYEQYKEYAKKYDVTIKVIANKVENQEDINFIKQYVGEDLIAVFCQSHFVKKIDRGQLINISELEKENLNALNSITECINSQKKNWKKFYQQAVEFHVKNAHSWANTSIGKDITHQIDPLFNIEKVVSG